MLTQTRQAVGLVLMHLRTLLAIGLLLLLTTLFGCGDDSSKNKTDLKPLYGPPPKDIGVDKPLIGKDLLGGEGCRPVALYGPMPCQNDSDCVKWNGAGWYCDKNNSFDNGCGGKSSWPACRPSVVKDAGPSRDGCQPVALYGPPPCQSDTECVTTYGPGWYCDKNNSFGNGCGGINNWPVCRPPVNDASVSRDGCMPMTLYGPPPCSSDADCERWYGAGYTCNKNNTYPNGCGGTGNWPICEKK